MQPMELTPELRHARPEPPLQMEAIFGFQNQLFHDMASALTALGAYLGDRLDLFSVLARSSPASAEALARSAGLCPAMTAEWLKLMVCAGYVNYNPEERSFALPDAHAVILANRSGPLSAGGGLQQIGAFASQLPALRDAFTQGGGVPQHSYTDDLRDGMERMSATWFEHELVSGWISALPDIRSRLEAGAAVADVGCGAGRALIELASTFPASRFVGYDAFEPALDQAARHARAAGVAERIRFELRDMANGLSDRFDLVCAFDSLHDVQDLTGAMRAIADALKKDGALLVLELPGTDDLLEERGPVGVIHHGTKLFYNLPVALAASGGHTPRPVTFTEECMRRLCRGTRLEFVRTIPVRNPLHRLYQIRRRG